MSSYKPVTAAVRVLDVLASANRLRDNATVGEIHRETGLDKSTIVRMLETLIESGYIVRSPDSKGYRVTGRTLMLSSAFDSHKLIGAIVGPLLNDFRQSIGWPSDVAIFDRDAMLVIESSRLGGPMSFNRAPGYRAPVFGTSLGLAYIAYAAPEELEVAIKTARANPSPWNKLAHDKKRLDDFLARVRKQGFATMEPTYSRQEYANRVSSIGVPIRSNMGVYAAINVIYLRNTLSFPVARSTLLGRLQDAAEKMAYELMARMPTVD